MAKISLCLDTRGKTPIVKLLVTETGKSRMLTLGVKLENKEQWDPEAKDGPIVQKDGARSYNAMLRAKLRSAKEAQADLERDTDGCVDFQSLCDAVSIRINPEKAPKPTGELITAWKEFVDRKEGRTWELYAETHKRIDAFIEETKRTPFAQMTFADVTLEFVDSFDQYLARTRGVNARAIDLKNLRAVCHWAFDMDKTNLYVWKRRPIRREDPKDVETFTDAQFRAIMTYDLSNRPDLQHYRDIALLGLYLIGINIVDMHALTHVDADGYIRYKRAKTGRQYKIKVEPEALAIINKYRGQEHLLVWADRYRDYKSFAQHLNEEGIQRIGRCEVVTIDGSYHSRTKNVYYPIVKNATYYWFRRYWATVAYNLEISEDVIAQALGHGRRTVTDVYIRKDQKKVDDANRRVIDYVQNLIK